MRHAGIALAALLLSACSSLPPAAPQAPAQLDGHGSFSLSSRISARTGDQRFAGLMSWQHSNDSAIGDEVTLSSPLGQGIARIRNNAEGALLEKANGESYRAADAESLTEALLGWRLPLNRLSNWINNQSDTRQLSQNGWQVEYVERDPAHRPTAMDLNYGEVEVQLRAIHWLATDTPAPQTPPAP